MFDLTALTLHNNCSEDYGIHLVIDKVKADSPAWKGGLRSLDCIVSVHGWLLTFFDKAEVT